MFVAALNGPGKIVAVNVSNPDAPGEISGLVFCTIGWCGCSKGWGGVCSGGEDEPLSFYLPTPGRIRGIDPDGIGGIVGEARKIQCFRPVHIIGGAALLCVAALNRPADQVTIRVVDLDFPGETQGVVNSTVGWCGRSKGGWEVRFCFEGVPSPSDLAAVVRVGGINPDLITGCIGEAR